MFKKHSDLLLDNDDEEELARKVMEVTPSSSESKPVTFLKEDLKNSIRSETFFMNNLKNVNKTEGTSFDDLREFN